ncbi:MAG: hypothetical protein ABIQ27_05875 [Flavobacterium sp.]|uniref:hypothetical protein n=1 Tax=Flavobacterium sp. TaxID=239 RepID=UPI0032671732
MKKKSSNSQHILNTSANLLGLCFIVLTSRNILDMKAATLIDELTAFAIFSFMFSCILSFLAMRSKTEMGIKYEKYADVLFFVGLSSLFVTATLITLNIIE